MANSKVKNKKPRRGNYKENNKKTHKLTGERLDFVLQNLAELKKDTEIAELYKAKYPGKSIVFQTVNYYRHHKDFQGEIKARRENWRNGYLENIPLANKTKRLEELTKLYNSLTDNGNEDMIKASGAEGVAVGLKILAQIQKETEGILGKKGLDGNPSDLPGGLSANLTATIDLGNVGSGKLRDVVKCLEDGASEEG